MIVHNAIFQLDPTLTPAQVATLGEALLSLKDHISTIRAISWHDNVTDEPLHHGFLHVLRVTFDDKAGLDTYVPHPYHVEVCERHLMPALKNGLQESVIVVDHTL